MIICHSRKFIFIKTRKTASTSLERFLHASLERGDIWTPLSDPKTPGNRYILNTPLDTWVGRIKPLNWVVRKTPALNARRWRDHVSMAELRQRMGEMHGYFKFCFDRNPWDWFVSLFFHQKAYGKASDFDTFLYTAEHEPNWMCYTVDGSVAVDAVYRYEELPQRVGELVSRLGLITCDLPRDKSQYRPVRGYRQFYSQSARDEVAKRCSFAIENLSYDF